MEQNKYFENTHTNAGTIKAGTKNVKMSWAIKDGMDSEIEHIKPGCGCTDALIDGNVVNAKYHDSSDVSVINSNNSKSILVTKSLTAYLKDGKPLKVKNDRGLEIFNPDKKSIRLTFTVTVTS